MSRFPTSSVMKQICAHHETFTSGYTLLPTDESQRFLLVRVTRRVVFDVPGSFNSFALVSTSAFLHARMFSISSWSVDFKFFLAKYMSISHLLYLVGGLDKPYFRRVRNAVEHVVGQARTPLTFFAILNKRVLCSARGREAGNFHVFMGDETIKNQNNTSPGQGYRQDEGALAFVKYKTRACVLKRLMEVPKLGKCVVQMCGV